MSDRTFAPHPWGGVWNRFEEIAADYDRAMAENDMLRIENAALREKVRVMTEAREGLVINGRPAVDLREAAKRSGVTYVTAWRYFKSGHWQGVEVEGGSAVVYTDQPLEPKRPKRAEP